jgi:type VI secretion system protein ImpL
VLFRAWTRGTEPDSTSAALARVQFDEYARQTAIAPLWAATADAAVVGRARDHLARFAGIDPIYQSMLSEASTKAPAIRLAEAVPQAAGTVTTGNAVVAGPFTAAGWRAMTDILRDADRFFQGERWVVGDQSAVAQRDRAKDLADIRARYVADYIAQWRAALRGVGVPRPGTVKESAARLGRIGGAQSPLLAVLAIAAQNTNVDSAVIRAFQPVHAVTPPTVKDKFVSESNQPYVDALLTLQGAMEQLGNLPPATDTASAEALAQGAQTALAQATQAKVAARQVAQKFAVDADAAAIGPTIAMLLEAPIGGAEGALRTVAAVKPPAPKPAPAEGGGGGGGGGGGSAKGAELAVILNNRGKDLCKSMERILGRFPFNPDGGDANVNDVRSLLAPGTGSLWAFYDERLVPLLPRQGGQYVAKPANDVVLNPKFVEFFNRMARASFVLFADRQSTPRMNLTVKGLAGGDVSMLTLVHGDRTLRWGPGAAVAPLAWPPSGGNTARLLATVGGKEREIAKGDGPWALFRLLARATAFEGTGLTRRATFSGAASATLELTAPSPGPLVGRGSLSGPACVMQVTQ